MSERWLAIASTVPWLVVPVIIFIGRHWIVARISKGVQHHFDNEIEKLRAELRKNEEQYKSELRQREVEIATLRNNVLTGSASRQALLDKRRFEAVEKVWSAVNELGQLKSLSATMAVLNYQAVAKQAADPKMQQFLTIIGSGVPEPKNIKNVARDEQPFLPVLAWAYFNAYTTILYGSYLRYSVLKTGTTDPDKFISTDGIRQILKAVLPHQTLLKQ
ncbi:MAG: hypothetical protein ACLQFW_09195 [Xanthobacteraceae bacterium]